jgi:hypothetical protein
MARPRKIWPGCDGVDFREARLLSGQSMAAAARLLRVSVRTVRNWEHGRSRVPYSAFKLMRVLTGYALPHEAWAGWRVRGDTLWSPTGRAFPVWGMGYLSLIFGMARQFLIDRGHSGDLPIDRTASRPGAQPGRLTRVTAPGNPASAPQPASVPRQRSRLRGIHAGEGERRLAAPPREQAP